MKTFLLFVLSVFTVNGLTAQNKAGEVCYNPNLVKDTSKRSINSRAVAVINGDSLIVSYHSPGVRKRVIWGGLVPYDEVWVTGAHDATALEIKKPIVINGKEIMPGKYAFFTIPGKKEWVAIINRNWQQHLASEYDEKEDVVRLKIKPKAHHFTERLQYFIEPGQGNNGKIAMAWEKVRIEVPFTVIQ